MKLPSKIYDILKWVFILALPAIGSAYLGLAAIWGWPYADQVSQTITIACTLGGALIGISSASYYKDGTSGESPLEDDGK